jgi:hypothetical protein
MNKKKFSDYIKAFDFKNLFIDLGWDNYSGKEYLSVDDSSFELQGIVEKKGFVIAQCSLCSDGSIPVGNIRKKIENAFRKHHHEHLIIYENAQKTRQIWQYVVHEPDKPRKTREIQYSKDQDPEILYQRARGLLFSLDEEENITLIDVTTRFRENFAQNTEQVTKKFYTEFKNQHNVFLSFISGIDDLISDEENKNKQWYTSLMLNRLMFCYFIQKRGYLDQNIHYLREKFHEVKSKAGDDKFYSFYRSFLLELFHKGLGQPENIRELSVELGIIPYLDGGLFDVHELERQFDEINIADQAFEKIFSFFDQWNWHLDTRVESSGRDINPDVIGYIFEKYINDRAAMGAYYTKEDITEYIGKNTIIPCLFDKVRKEYPAAFARNSYIWTHLRASGDAYIYDAVKKGIPEGQDLFSDLPEEIKAGFVPDLEQQKVTDETTVHLWEIRKCWNKKAHEGIALPTETYRELIERRKRYAKLKSAIEQSQITEINDFITHNLNIRQFAQDILESIDDPEFIKYFFKALQSITILDPTCGSGAFLFAALNILEPLYETCIERMEQFTSEKARKYRFFHEVLAEANSVDHPNLNYYIYKTIILRNLYGVDIMNEAVEIAKLRLFLKMVGAVDISIRKPNMGLEPLPDVDFNIRSGNTLVGFASENNFKKVVRDKSKILSTQIIPRFEDEFLLTAKDFKNFQNSQLKMNKTEDTYEKAKDELRKRLNDLNEKLNEYLALTYGIDREKQKSRYTEWLNSHQPFNWFAEFYEIINGRGGFDVVIGNPPYIAITKINYQIKNDRFIVSDLYGYIIKRVFSILSSNARHGFIVMHNLAFSHSFRQVRSAIMDNSAVSWFSFFARIPAGLFSGDVRVRNCIYLIDKVKKEKKISYTTRIHRWFAGSRPFLMDKIKYVIFSSANKIPMFNDQTLSDFFPNMQGKPLQMFVNSSSSNVLYYKQSAYNWISVSCKPAPCYSDNGKEIPQSQVKAINILNREIKNYLLLLFNGDWQFVLSRPLTRGGSFFEKCQKKKRPPWLKGLFKSEMPKEAMHVS